MKLDMTFEESNQRIDMTFAEIQTASDGGFERGYEQGYNEGNENGYTNGYVQGQTEGYTEGKKSEYDRFWDDFQDNGNRTDYCCGFATRCWNEKTFKPKYNIIPNGSCTNMFYNCGILDMVTLLERLGVVLDFSNATAVNSMFANSIIKRLGVLDFQNATLNQVFQNCKDLITIEKIILKKTQTFAYSFHVCTNLTNLIVEGEIGQSVNFQWSSLLTVESAKNIIQCLANYKGTSSDLANTITFHANVWSALEAEGNTSPNGNAWVDYLYDIGWSYS